jgi:NADH-quinone oxidoreductase subunit I
MKNCCYIKDILQGGVSLLKGMGVTIRYMFSTPITVQWPRETAPLPTRFRGHIELVFDSENNRPKCIACLSCVRACPSQCIAIKGAKVAGEKKKRPVMFELDYTKCSICGLCVESCPVSALRFSRNYALADYTLQDFAKINLLAGFSK